MKNRAKPGSNLKGANSTKIASKESKQPKKTMIEEITGKKTCL